MSFVEKIKSPDERLIGVASIHWIYGVKGLLWMAGLMFVGMSIDNLFTSMFIHFADNPAFRVITGFSNLVFWICTVLGLILFFFYVLMMATTEIGLTDKRVIFKKGFLMVDVKEVDLEEIKGAEVNNGIFGRILNYGYIMLDARFVENLGLPAVSDPYRYMKALNEMRSKLKEGGMHVSLDAPDGREVAGHLNKLEKEQQKEEAQQQEEPPHKLYEKRYKALNDNPLDAINDLIDDTQEEIENVTQTAPKTSSGKPVKIPGSILKRLSRPAAGPIEGEPGKKRRPIWFRQERMREAIKDSFSENTASN